MHRNCDSWTLTKAVMIVVAVTAIASSLVVTSMRGRDGARAARDRHASLLVVAPATMERALSLEEGRR
jgi:hypothetical protein